MEGIEETTIRAIKVLSATRTVRLAGFSRMPVVEGRVKQKREKNKITQCL